jgi:hypothetical protein
MTSPVFTVRPVLLALSSSAVAAQTDARWIKVFADSSEMIAVDSASVLPVGDGIYRVWERGVSRQRPRCVRSPESSSIAGSGWRASSRWPTPAPRRLGPPRNRATGMRFRPTVGSRPSGNTCAPWQRPALRGARQAALVTPTGHLAAYRGII